MQNSINILKNPTAHGFTEILDAMLVLSDKATFDVDKHHFGTSEYHPLKNEISKTQAEILANILKLGYARIEWLLANIGVAHEIDIRLGDYDERRCLGIDPEDSDSFGYFTR